MKLSTSHRLGMWRNLVASVQHEADIEMGFTTKDAQVGCVNFISYVGRHVHFREVYTAHSFLICDSFFKFAIRVEI